MIRTFPFHTRTIRFDCSNPHGGAFGDPATFDENQIRMIALMVMDSYAAGQRKQAGKSGPVHVEVSPTQIMVWCTFEPGPENIGAADEADIVAQLTVGCAALRDAS